MVKSGFDETLIVEIGGIWRIQKSLVGFLVEISRMSVNLVDNFVESRELSVIYYI